MRDEWHCPELNLERRDVPVQVASHQGERPLGRSLLDVWPEVSDVDSVSDHHQVKRRMDEPRGLESQADSTRERLGASSPDARHPDSGRSAARGSKVEQLADLAAPVAWKAGPRASQVERPLRRPHRENLPPVPMRLRTAQVMP